ncbi:hypothetical protein ACJX0J_005597, partial [Zea mays]
TDLWPHSGTWEWLGPLHDARSPSPFYPSNEGEKSHREIPLHSLPRGLVSSRGPWGTARNHTQPLTGERRGDWRGRAPQSRTQALNGCVTLLPASAPFRLPPIPRRRPRLLLLLVVIRRLVVVVRPQSAVRRPPLRVRPRPAAAEYMSLPASQYSVLDAERIERVDDSTFRCYVYRFRFFALEVCPVLLVRVDEEPDGCCIRLLSCKLEGSPLVEAQNDKFSASMANRVFCSSKSQDSTLQQLTSDTTIEVAIDIPFPFRAIPVEAIESSGRQVLEQLLRVMLPRFLKQ